MNCEILIYHVIYTTVSYGYYILNRSPHHCSVCSTIQVALNSELSREFIKSPAKRTISSYMYRSYRPTVYIRNVPKVGQMGPKWDKSGTSSVKISEHFCLGDMKKPVKPRFCENVLKSDLEKSLICPI